MTCTPVCTPPMKEVLGFHGSRPRTGRSTTRSISSTKFGPLDVVFVPDGAPAGFDDLSPDAQTRAIIDADATALVISVARWERLKQMTGRAKDLGQVRVSVQDHPGSPI